MSALLQAELIKLATTRTFAALAVAAVATSTLITGLIALFSEPTPQSVLVDVFTNDTTSLFILILAIVGISGEWRHRTITSSLLAAPHRIRFLAAKTIAFAAAGLVLSVMISVAMTLVGALILSARDLPVPDASELLAQIGRNAAVAALLGGLGVGIGALIRVQPVAIVGVLLASFVFEPGLLALEPDVGRFGPLVGLTTPILAIPDSELGINDVNLFDPAAAVFLMVAWIAVLFALAAFLLQRRDVE